PGVRGLEGVTGNAQVVRVGSRVPKTSAGFDLKDLFVGSEGTLGVITEIALALAPVPPGTARATLAFSTLSDACAAAAEMAAYVPELAAVEVADRDTMDALRALPGLRDLPAGDVLFLETHGRPDDCAAGIEAACGVAAVHGGATVAGIDDPWAVRHRMTRTIREAAGAAGVARTDCAVPLPALSRFVHEAKARVASDRNRTSGGQRRLYVFGHAGVGIVHCLMPLGGAGAWTPDEARIEKSALASRAVALGGTVTGEHGIGLGHRDSLRIEHPDGVGYMRRIKSVFDPLGIMNPDKVF
ncbi:MAG: FAD-binding oxidoreductase, partial [Deltaproteobacteria bacterium]|nr:FAD-binding oxidoreductase [Deltaproteobacteria bacterium]